MPMTPFEASQLLAGMTDQEAAAIAQGQSPFPQWELKPIDGLMEVERRKVFREKYKAIEDRRQQEEEANRLGLPPSPVPSVNDSRIAGFLGQEGSQGITSVDPNAGQQVPPDQMAQLQGGIAGGPPQGMPPQGMPPGPPGMAVAGGGLIPRYHPGGEVEGKHPDHHLPENWYLPKPSAGGEYEDFEAQLRAIQEGREWRTGGRRDDLFEQYLEKMGPMGRMVDDPIIPSEQYLEETLSREEWDKFGPHRKSFAPTAGEYLFSDEYKSARDKEQQQLSQISSPEEWAFVQEHAGEYGGVGNARELYKKHGDPPTIGGVEEDQIVEGGGTTTTRPEQVSPPSVGDDFAGVIPPEFREQYDPEYVPQPTADAQEREIGDISGIGLPGRPDGEVIEFDPRGEAWRTALDIRDVRKRRGPVEEYIDELRGQGLERDLAIEAEVGRSTEAGYRKQLEHLDRMEGQRGAEEDLAGMGVASLGDILERAEEYAQTNVERAEDTQQRIVDAGVNTAGQLDDWISREKTRTATGIERIEREGAQAKRAMGYGWLADIVGGGPMGRAGKYKEAIEAGVGITGDITDDVLAMQKDLATNEKQYISDMFSMEKDINVSGVATDALITGIRADLIDENRLSTVEVIRIGEKVLADRRTDLETRREIEKAISEGRTSQLRKILEKLAAVKGFELTQAEEALAQEFGPDREFLADIDPLIRGEYAVETSAATGRESAAVEARVLHENVMMNPVHQETLEQYRNHLRSITDHADSIDPRTLQYNPFTKTVGVDYDENSPNGRKYSEFSDGDARRAEDATTAQRMYQEITMNQMALWRQLGDSLTRKGGPELLPSQLTTTQLRQPGGYLDIYSQLEESMETDPEGTRAYIAQMQAYLEQLAAEQGAESPGGG